MITQYVDKGSNQSNIASICDIYDLKEYFDVIKSHKAHKLYIQKLFDKTDICNVLEKKDDRYQKQVRSTEKTIRIDNSETGGRSSSNTIEGNGKFRSLLEKQKNPIQFSKNALKNALKQIEHMKAVKQIDEIKENLTSKADELYLGSTYMTFTSMTTCIKVMKIFERGHQFITLAPLECTSYKYLNQIQTKFPPLLDDIRWQNVARKRGVRLYIPEITFILVCCIVHTYLEYFSNTLYIKKVMIEEKKDDMTMLRIQRYSITFTQLSLSTISILILRWLLSLHRYRRKSDTIGTRFIFFNFYLISIGSISGLYGFYLSTKTTINHIPSHNIDDFRFYVQTQWIKSSFMVTFIPVFQKVFGDVFLMKFVKPRAIRFLRFFKRKINKRVGRRKRISSIDTPEIADDEFTSFQLSDGEESSEDEVLKEQNKKKDEHYYHDFGLNSSYLAQIFFFLGLYLPLTGSLFFFVCGCGTITHYLVEFYVIGKFTERSPYLSIPIVFKMVKYSFIFFGIGSFLSIKSTEFFIQAEEVDVLTTQFNNFFEFEKAIKMCMLLISLLFMYALATPQVLYRLITTLGEINEYFCRKHSVRLDFFFKDEFLTQNYKFQNPFYSFLDLERGMELKNKSVIKRKQSESHKRRISHI